MHSSQLRASIDLGTNTCLLLILDGDVTLVDESRIVRLGEGVDRERKLQPQAVDRTLSCLKGYTAQVKAAGISPAQVACVATSQARDAKNGAEFFSRVKEETGFVFRTISGEEEAQLTFQGALLPRMDPNHSFVIDIGGGSTEIISKHFSKSLDIGSVRFTERFFQPSPIQSAVPMPVPEPVTDESFWACQEAVDQALEPWVALSMQGRSREDSLVAVAGTATTLAAWYLELKQFDAEKINSVVLSRGDIHRMVEELKWRTLEERKQLPGIEPARADVILAGALILWRTLELLGFSECRVSTRGLRYGILLGESHSLK